MVPQNSFGARLKRRRETLGLRQEDVAYRVGVTSSTISRIENGKRYLSLLFLEKLAQAVDMTLIDLLEQENEDSSPNKKTVDDDQADRVGDVTDEELRHKSE